MVQKEKDSISNLAQMSTNFTIHQQTNRHRTSTKHQYRASSLMNHFQNHQLPQQQPNRAYNYSSTSKQSVIKYDPSMLFFWIFSAFALILPFSCFFFVWFYCCKKCKRSSIQDSRRRRSMRNLQSIRGMSRLASMRAIHQPRDLDLDNDERTLYFFNTASGNHQSANHVQATDSDNLYYVPNIQPTTETTDTIYNYDSINNIPSESIYGTNVSGFMHFNNEEENDNPPNYYDVISIKNANIVLNKLNNNKEFHPINEIENSSNFVDRQESLTRPVNNRLSGNNNRRMNLNNDQTSNSDIEQNRAIINVISNNYRHSALYNMTSNPNRYMNRNFLTNQNWPFELDASGFEEMATGTVRDTSTIV